MEEITIIYATGNRGKVNEVTKYFKAKGENIKFKSLKDIEFKEEVEETGETFEENSYIKAKAVKEFCSKRNINEIIVADDSGLCIDILGGKPGVYSDRYAGENATQKDKIEKILKEMKDVQEENRNAKFVCVLTAIMPNGEVITSRGETLGKIAQNYTKLEKLTYDPIFIPRGFNKAKVDINERELGDLHREKAFEDLIKKIRKCNNIF